jgi:hypothetical protein
MRTRWRLIPLFFIISAAFLDQQKYHVDAAACKGCAPPCVCPGTDSLVPTEKCKFLEYIIKVNIL